MCLCLLALDTHPEDALVLALNRDEYYARPTAPAHFWTDLPEILAGRDREGGGTWLGVARTGRLALVTNVRDPAARVGGAASRGLIVSRLLTSPLPPEDALREIMKEAARYNPFNAIVGTARELFFASSRAPRVAAIPPGVHGLSNALLDTPWPKVRRGKAAFESALASPGDPTEPIFSLMGDTSRAADAELPSTGVGLELERVLSPIFIETAEYGTRSTTILRFGRDGAIRFAERSRNADGTWQRVDFSL